MTVASVPAFYVTDDAIENNCPKKQRVRRFQPTGLPISLVLFWRQYRWTAVLLHWWGHRYSTGASPRRWKISPVLHRQTVISTSAPPRCTGGPAAKFCRWSTSGQPVDYHWNLKIRIQIWRWSTSEAPVKTHSDCGASVRIFINRWSAGAAPVSSPVHSAPMSENWCK